MELSAYLRPPAEATEGGSPWRAERSRGVTYLELVATAAIVMILASAILPMGRVAVRRQREIELRRELRKMREAINRYKQAVDQGQIGGTDVKLGSEGYPPDLETLVKGVNRVGALDRKLKFLRRIPVDPMTGDGGVGPALLPGRPRQHVLVRRERLGRLLEEHGEGARWHELQHLVRRAAARRRASR